MTLKNLRPGQHGFACPCGEEAVFTSVTAWYEAECMKEWHTQETGHNLGVARFGKFSKRQLVEMGLPLDNERPDW